MTLTNPERIFFVDDAAMLRLHDGLDLSPDDDDAVAVSCRSKKTNIKKLIMVISYKMSKKC